MKTEVVRARVDPHLKNESEKVFAGLGLSTTEAIRLFLHQVKLRKGLPFSVVLPENENNDIIHPALKRSEALDLIDED